MIFEKRGVLFRVTLKNLVAQEQEVDVAADLIGMVGKYETGWDWGYPVPRDPKEFSAQRSIEEASLIIRHLKTSARVAFAFAQNPDQLEQLGDHGHARWKVALRPNESRSIGFVMVVGEREEEEVLTLAKHWASAFETTFMAAKDRWQRRFNEGFTPGNGFFSGSLPVLITRDQSLRRVYYMSVLSMLIMLRTNFTLQPRVYITCAPQYAVTLTYFWDSAMVPVLTALLDPAMMRDQLKRWLTMDVHRYFAQDFFSGQGSGVWYSANDVSLFGMLQTYVQVTGDLGFLDEKAGEKTVIEQMGGLVTHWRQLARNDCSLADYGGVRNLLECVPTYTHGVASLNAANVGMMRAFANLIQSRGDRSGAEQLREDAKHLAAAVLRLYVPGQGVWNCLQPDGKHQEVRHVYDFIMTAKWIPEDLPASMRSEMLRFVEQELMTKYWLRALSLKDPAASRSDRPDHGPMGAYDGWPPLTLEAMHALGFKKEALHCLYRFEKVTHEGPFSQSHELLGREFDAPVRVAEKGGQATNELCGGTFAEVIIRSFFGFQPDWEGRKGLVEPESSRGFSGRLVGLRWRGKLYNVTSDDHGLSMQRQ
jgi:hypothetical protein